MLNPGNRRNCQDIFSVMRMSNMQRTRQKVTKRKMQTRVTICYDIGAFLTIFGSKYHLNTMHAAMKVD